MDKVLITANLVTKGFKQICEHTMVALVIQIVILHHDAIDILENPRILI